MPTRSIRRTLAGIVAMWLVATFVAAPAIMTWVHGGGGPGILQGFMGGRAHVPLETYLLEWREHALQAGFLLVTASLIIWFATPLFPLLRSSVPPASTHSRIIPVSFREAMWVSLWCGLLFGLGEAHYLGWKAFVLYEVVPQFRFVSPHSLWMAPVVDVLVFGSLGALVYLVQRLVTRHASVRWVVFCLATVAVTSLVLMTGRLAWWSATLLALGLAWRLSILAHRHQPAFLDLVRRWTMPMAAVVPVVAVLVTGIPLIAEHRAGARLGPPPPPAMPNVLLIVLDTERASEWSLHGYPRATTPNLDRRARDAVVFDRAIATASWTLPSHASMFTGRYPNELGTTFLDRLDATYPTLAEVLGARGYATAGFVANLVFCTPLFGLNRGFVHYEAQPVSLGMALESAWLPRYTIRNLLHARHKYGVRKDAGRITSDFLDWHAERPSDRPYFAFLNYFDAHVPYRSPPQWQYRFGDGQHATPVVRSNDPDAYEAWERRALRDAYDGAISYIDASVESLLSTLEARGDLERTVVIVTSDHGEEFGEHGYMGHGQGAHLPAINVPLLVLYPRLPGGLRVSHAVTLADLPASVMDLVGQEDHPFPGRSWARYWRSGEGNLPPAEPVVSEYLGRRSILAGNWHYIEDNGEQLYDTRADPPEAENLIASADSALLRRLRALLDSLPVSDP